ncbi:hypothetical protein [Georgenia sp. Marseille-Q6866]
MTDEQVPESIQTDEAWAADRAAQYARLQNHAGRIASNRWDSLQRVHKVLSANEAELLTLIASFETNPEVALEIISHGDGRQEARELYFDELLRRMHNYLSAVKMLVDHTRNLVKQYPGQPFVEEFRSKVTYLASRGRGPFLQKLRDYLVHYRIPPFGMTMKLVGQPEFTVHLDREAALEFRDWPAIAKEFLREQPAEIPLAPLVRDYSQDLEELYSWLYNLFHELHAADVADYNALLVDFQGARNTPGHPDYKPPSPPPRK